MADTVFFERAGPFSLRDIAARTGVALADEAAADREVSGVAPLEAAGPRDLTFFDNPRYLDAFRATRAAACFTAPRYAKEAPSGTVLLLAREPYRAFAQAAALFHPDAMRPRGALDARSGISPDARIHARAKLEDDVTVEPFASVGAEAEIGRGTVIATGAVVGRGVRIGRDCSIGPGASVLHALLGNRVILHPGVRIGQDGFGFAMGAKGHLKVPQIGRVIIQDDVEIGANTTVDRGANRDTVIGEGTKIDNQVQIGHNVVIGRHCVIVAQVGISGSTTLEDFVVLGGQVGVVGHLRIGMGAQIAGSSNVNSDVPPGARWGGTPAKPVREWFRELTTLKTLASRAVLAKDGGTSTPE